MSEDPVFIIGHWRSGTTLLHQLMALDPRLSAPTLFQVAIPDSFLVSYPYYRPIFRFALTGSRPMDNVRIGMDEPQEDEYAIYRITPDSPLEELVFGKDPAYFIHPDTNVRPAGDKRERWKDSVDQFYRKVSLASGKRVVSKNPFHSFRIGVLKEMYPGARFICMVRTPFEVLPSTLHMWEIIARQNALGKASRPRLVDAIGVLKELYRVVDQDRNILKDNQFTYIRYEDLVTDPIRVLRSAYECLELEWNDDFERSVREFMRQNEGYEKNSFRLTPEEADHIAREMHDQLRTFRYEVPVASTPTVL